MRKVFRSHSEVAHIWAQQNQEEGRALNVFFQGPSIYSYGRHFEIARFVKSDVVLFTTRSYSVSTAKHKRCVLNAIDHKKIFTVPSFDYHNDNGKYYINAIQKAHDEALRSKRGPYYRVAQLEGIIKEAHNYLKEFRGDIAPEIRKSINKVNQQREKDKLFNKDELAKMEKNKESYKKFLASYDATRKYKWENHARLQKEAQEKREKEYLENIEKWKNGENVCIQGYGLPVFLRVKDGRIETSRGAQITVRTAVRLWERIKAGENVAGMKLDNYEAVSLENNILTVGCHQIAYSELERIANVLNQMTLPLEQVNQ